MRPLKTAEEKSPTCSSVVELSSLCFQLSTSHECQKATFQSFKIHWTPENVLYFSEA